MTSSATALESSYAAAAEFLAKAATLGDRAVADLDEADLIDVIATRAAMPWVQSVI